MSEGGETEPESHGRDKVLQKEGAGWDLLQVS